MKVITIFGKPEEEAEKDLLHYYDGPFEKVKSYKVKGREAHQYKKLVLTF